jgi:hypothetical protein
MANEPFRIKHFNLFIGGKKLGTMESADYEIAGNDEEHITAEGWSASDGQTTSKINANTIVPVDGKTDYLVDALLTKKYIKVQTGIVDGKVHFCTMRCMNVKYNTDPKTGSLKGAFAFSGGKPSRS